MNARSDDSKIAVPQAQMVPTKKGDVAPFDGTLMNPAAVATLIAQINASKEQSTLDVKRAIDMEQARAALDRARLEANLDFARQLADAQAKLRDDRIKQLVEAQRPDDRQWWVIGGVTGGILVTISAAFALSLAHR